MLSHPGVWDKPIAEVIHLWRHRTSTANNLEKSRLVCVLNIFCTFWTRMRKTIKHHIEGGTRESHPRVQDFLHPWLGKHRRGLQILDTRMGFPRPSLNVMLDSIIPELVMLTDPLSFEYPLLVLFSFIYYTSNTTSQQMKTQTLYIVSSFVILNINLWESHWLFRRVLVSYTKYTAAAVYMQRVMPRELRCDVMKIHCFLTW